MERKLTERRIVSMLVVLLVIEVTLLAAHLRFGGFRWTSALPEQRVAGRVIHSENELRRRGNNSLVWEKSGREEQVYFYDSILTLAQSTASLQLDQDTEVKLSENTLVSIEPQEKRGTGEIRLKFVKGSLKARNPYATAHLEADAWAMEIKSGTELDFRQVGDGNFELQVTKGEVNFKDAKGEAKVTSSEMLRIQDGEAVQKLAIDEGLRWIEPPPARIYTHVSAQRVGLKWNSASVPELVVQTLGQNEKLISIGGRTQIDLDLPLGQHHIFLRGEQRVSPALTLEIWKAPLLHLVSPLPRNRVRLGDKTAFVWMTAPEVKSYSFILRGHTVDLKREVGENSYATKLETEDDAEWSIEGKDLQGFPIPPLYTYPIYIREAPLAAPKLRAPVLRQPAKADDRGAGYWFALLPQAFADEVFYQAVFDWEKVEGADRYVIEISETPDFRNPLVNKTLNSNQFVWKKIKLRSYYWRVAAEARSGRLGLFSEPELVDLKTGGQIGVAVTPLESPKPAPSPPEEKVEKAPEPVVFEPQPIPPSQAPEKSEIKPRAFITWLPRYSSLKVSAREDVSATFSGANLMSFAVGADRVFEGEKMVRLQLNYAHETYKPQPKESYPDQGAISWNEISFTAALHKNSSHLGYGLYVERGADLIRENDQSVNMKAANFIGVCFQTYFQAGRATYLGEYILEGGSAYGLITRQDLHFAVGGTGLYLGLGGDGNMRSRSGAHSSMLSGRAVLGFEF